MSSPAPTEDGPATRPGPRSLAEALRVRDDASLVALLRARPDLLNPVPVDLTQLATRAATRASVLRALERLDRFALQTAEALAVAPDPAPYSLLEGLLTGDEGDPVTTETLPRTLALLRERALVWGPDERLRLVRTARELLAPSAAHPSPTGLGPSLAEATAGMSPGRLQVILTEAGLGSTHDSVTAVQALTALFTDPARLGALLDEAPADAVEVLGRLVWGPPYGQVTAHPATHLRWLLDHGLLVPTAPGTVVLPREVALHLRGGRAHRAVEPEPPAIAVRAVREEREADAAAAGQAYAALQTLEDLLKEWGSPRQSWSRTKDLGPAVLRAGGLSQRDLKRTAGYLETSEDIAAFWLELAYAAGLVAADGEADEHYAPTPYFDEWLDLPPARRWAVLATAWLGATRTSGLVGGSDSKDRTLSALGPHLDRTAAPEVRHRVLALLAELSPGSVPEPDSLLARLRWERPLRGAAHENDLRTRIAGWTLDEAELLGVTGRGALTRQGRALLAGQDTALVDMLAELLPPPLDHVLLQADLTAVAPGPLQRPLAERLALLADVESKGGATVYRFTPGSVRRSLDAGYSAEAIHEFLTTHSLTPVPQPLAYLVDDVARRHGHLRVGAASSYVRCEEATVLDEILADRRSETLRLRRLAPTVAASPSEPAVLLDGLRGLGFAPAAEGPGGDVLVRSSARHRTPPRRAPEPVGEGGARPRQTMLAAAVRAIRAGDTAVTTPPPAPPAGLVTPSEPPRSSASETLVTLQNAVLTGESVWIGYIDAEGAADRRLIAPVRVEGGFVTAYDHTAEELRTYPLHRVTGVAELPAPAEGEPTPASGQGGGG
ncbi:helicase-associated domain-containing protein [Streptomyces sp. NPDC058426]|uniref:helicase-associated domain-containing protein n=1 Tax=unclassified Streptomyces TaxID=2593676 RepID=UPI0036625C28